MVNLASVLWLAGVASGFQTGAAQPEQAVLGPETRVTIAQLEQVLARAAHARDAKVAEAIAALEIAERASSARLADWQTRFPGERTRQALAALADESAFLPPPAADIGPEPPPDAATQQKIVSQAAEYVALLHPKLPDFSALRTTTRFEKATPQQMRDQKRDVGIATFGHEKLSFHALGNAPEDGPAKEKLYFIDVSSTRVTNQNDREKGNENDYLMNPADRRLSTSGEFGPILSVVLGDSRQGQLSWAYWEQGRSGRRLAVFRYSVPKEKSHYAVYYAGSSEAEFPAYHGEIAIEPEDGSIYRISMQSEDPSRPGAVSGIAVEYGPTEIGGKTYICPQKSVAISHAPGLPLFINDVSFTEYHLFRGETRILP